MSALKNEHHAALAEFAAKEGRFWKKSLRDNWARASYPGYPDTEHLLHQARNVIGPSGLEKYKLLNGG
jgi:hypothetical protein